MALSIKNPRAEQLARRVAAETGETMTAAVIVALTERLERIKGRATTPDLEAAILNISSRCASLPDLDRRSPDEILGYDEQGGFAPW